MTEETCAKIGLIKYNQCTASVNGTYSIVTGTGFGLMYITCRCSCSWGRQGSRRIHHISYRDQQHYRESFLWLALWPCMASSTHILCTLHHLGLATSFPLHYLPQLLVLHGRCQLVWTSNRLLGCRYVSDIHSYSWTRSAQLCLRTFDCYQRYCWSGGTSYGWFCCGLLWWQVRW